MPIFIPALVLVPTLATTTAEVSSFLIFEYCVLGSLGTLGGLYWAGVLNMVASMTTPPMDETTFYQTSLLIHEAIERINNSILQLCEILEKAKGHRDQICAHDKLTDEVCQNIRLHLKDIGSSVDLIRQLLHELKQVGVQDHEVFSQLMLKIQSLEKKLNEMKSKDFEKIKGLEEELEAKDKSLQNFFAANQLLNERISAFTQRTPSNR